MSGQLHGLGGGAFAHRRRVLAAWVLVLAAVGLAAAVGGSPYSTRVLTAGALTMTGVSAAFLLDPDPVIRSIGFALAVGVLLDAFVVRMTLVPAAMALTGLDGERALAGMR